MLKNNDHLGMDSKCCMVCTFVAENHSNQQITCLKMTLMCIICFYTLNMQGYLNGIPELKNTVL